MEQLLDRRTTPIPGTGDTVTVVRDPGGRLMRLTAGGRVHVETQGTERILGDGLARVAETPAGRAILRRVEAGGARWTERYAWDAGLRPVEVDGVAVARDAEGRVVACEGPGGAWRYAYRRGHLVGIEGPGVCRAIEYRGNSPLSVREDGVRRYLHHDAAGRRTDVPGRPEGWGVDEAGRLWTVRDPDGRIVRTYLWDGVFCIGRIDGPPGAPLAAVFSLDQTGTPVREIGRDGVRVLPRDAFGEGLLACDGVPGLFGGAVAGGHVHYRGRSLDPRLGAFDAPDPWDGGEDDPRRGGGWRGALPVEIEPERAYAVCRNDPVGRTDPTGEMSAGCGATLLTLSTLTWSSQHNLSSLLVLDFPLNFLLALTTFEGGKIGRWFDKEAMGSAFTGAWGFRFDPVGLERWNINVGRAWTYQHVIWARAEEFDELAHARVFVPDGAFEPALYGSVLRVSATADGDDRPATSFVLQGSGYFPGGGAAGQIPTPAPPWSRRGGGPAVRAMPGVEGPRFPEGGIHFQPREELKAPRGGRIEELEPVPDFATGVFQLRKVLSVPEAGLALAAGAEALVSDKARKAALVTVRSAFDTGSETRLRFERDPDLDARDGLRVRAVQPTPHAPEPLTAQPNGRFLAAGLAGPPVAVGEIFVLEQAGARVGVALVDAIEAGLAVDVNVAKAQGPRPHAVEEVREVGGADRDTAVQGPRELEFPAGTAPDEGTVIVVKAGGTATVRLVVDEASADRRTLDRDLPAAVTGAAAGSVKWRPAVPARAQPLGTWNRTSGSQNLTYEADATGTVIAAGHVVVRDADGDVLMARDVTAAGHDHILTSANPPPNGAGVYDVTRYVFGPAPDPADVGDCSMRSVHALALSAAPGATLTASPRPALALFQLASAPPLTANGTTLIAGVALPAAPGAAITLALPADAGKLVSGTLAGASGPTPGQPVVLNDAGAGAGPEPALVKRVALEVTFDRVLGLDAARKWSLAPLALGGFYYAAEVEAPDRVILSPSAYQLTAAGAPDPAAPRIAVQMPRLRAGEPVRAVWNGGADEDLFRVKSVEGTRLVLEGGDAAALIAAAPADLAVARLVLDGPDLPRQPGFGTSPAGTGRAEAGIRGDRLPPLAGPPPLSRARFDVWGPNGLSRADIWAVTDGVMTLPARIASQDALTVEFAAIPGTLAATVAADVIAPAPRAGPPIAPPPTVGHVSEYDVEGDDLVFHAVETLVFFAARVDPAGPNRIRVAADGAGRHIGLHHFARVRVRAKSAEYETRVTGVHALGLTLDEHEFSIDRQSPDPEFEIALLHDPLPDGPEMVLVLPHVSPGPGAAAADGQLSPGTVMIPDDDSESWHLDRRQSLVTHELRHTQQSAWMGPLLLGLLPIFLIDAIAEAAGSDLEDPAFSPYVEGRLVTEGGVRLLEIPDRRGLDFAEGRCVEVSQGGQAVPRRLGAEDGGRFRIDGLGTLGDGAVFLRLAKSDEGEVLAAIYDFASLASLGGVMTNVMSVVYGFLPTLIGGLFNLGNDKDFFDPFQLDFYPGRVADPDRPAAVELLPDGEGERIGLQRNDMVRVRAGEASSDLCVTSVGDGTVELNDVPPTTGDDGRLELAHIGDFDPLGGRNSFLSHKLHVDFLRWVYDPWGQLHYRTTPEPDGAWDWILRVARWAFSSTSWCLLPPGIFVWDNAIPQSRGDGHLTYMEQDASEISGDLYSPLGRLRGTLEVVGDLARYRYFQNPRTLSAVPLGAGDAAGVHVNQDLWTMPSAETTAAAVHPNDTTQAALASAAQLPDALYAKNPVKPDEARALPGQRHFRPSDRGLLPMAAHLERSIGNYVAFSRPPAAAGGHHRITVGPVNDAADGAAAQADGVQTLWFDRTVEDVTVRAAGREIANGGTLTLIPCQRATLSVEPGDGRRHRLMLRRPGDGAVVRQPDALGLQAQAATGTEPAEIARIHASNPFAIEEDEASPWPQFLYGEDLAIPVRDFSVEVVGTVGIHATLVPDPSTPPLPPVKARAKPGEEAFLLVPAEINSVRPGLAVAYPAVAAPGVPANKTDPNPAVRPETPVPEALAAALGDGGILRLTFAADDPPEEEAELTWTVQVRARQPKRGGGTEMISAEVEASIVYEPHFRLELPAAPADTVAQGADIVLTLTGGVKAGAVVVTPSAGITATVEGAGARVRIAAAAGAATTARQVVVEDAADPARRARRTLKVV